MLNVAWANLTMMVGGHLLILALGFLALTFGVGDIFPKDQIKNMIGKVDQYQNKSTPTANANTSTANANTPKVNATATANASIQTNKPNTQNEASQTKPKTKTEGTNTSQNKAAAKPTVVKPEVKKANVTAIPTPKK
jgi:hypothetical protein